VQRPTLPTTEQRLEARELYGADPEGYEAGRPEYPERVFHLLTARCGLSPGAAVLEIGSGTGRVTRRLTAMGAKVTALEPDHALASYLRKSLADTEVEVIEDTFESARLRHHHFDLVVAAMSFHWVDQQIGLPKIRQVLRPGGCVALWWTLFGDPSRPDPFQDATRDLLGAPMPPEPRGLPFEIDLDGWRHALSRGAGLVGFDAEVIRWTARLDTRQVRAFYASTIAVRRRPSRERERLLNELVTRADSHFRGIAERPFVTAVYTAHRADSDWN
jgi:SAM-dependent methyltransferase